MNPSPEAAVPTVHIVTDSSCDLPVDVADEFGISIVPLTIRFGEEEFVDRDELALSATMQSAELAARTVNQDTGIDLDVRVIDSNTITMGLGTIALACARAARDGSTVDEVETLARDLVDRTRVFGALDTLDNLKKGGRIGNAKAMLATALSIKPIIEVTGGVGMIERSGHTGADVTREFGTQPLLRVEDLTQALALDELHHDRLAPVMNP